MLLAANNTLLGRMLIGPFLGMVCLWRDDLAAVRAGDRRRGAGLGAAPGRRWCRWRLWLGARWRRCRSGSISLGCWLALSILRIRTFLEHQAHERAAARSVIIEDRGPLSILFLNNNFHAVHHANPRLPWYRLPAEYARAARGVAAAQRRLCLPLLRGGVRGAISARARTRWRIRSGRRRSRAGRDAPARRPLRDDPARLAALPMYDWPELRDATDRLWAALRDGLRAARGGRRRRRSTATSG